MAWRALRAAKQPTGSAAHVAELAAGLTELTDAYDALLRSHKKLRSRIGMRENRGADGRRESPQGQLSLDSTDKIALRLAARQHGLLR